MKRLLCNQFLPEINDVNQYVHWHEVSFDNIAKDYAQARARARQRTRLRAA